MRLSKRAFEEAITEMIGEDVGPIALALRDKKEVSELKLASRTKKDINQVRNLLYKLYNENLVSFTKKKDKDRGWYIYYWSFDKEMIKYLIKKMKKTKITRLRENLEKERHTTFFVCKYECTRLDFENATDFNFKCPECGSLLNFEENNKKISEIQRNIEKLALEIEVK